jgi:filamentous hemagglutinin
VIAAARHLDVSAARINASSGSPLAAGMQTDGHLAEAGSLNVQASSAITAHGQHLAAGALSLSAPASTSAAASAPPMPSALQPTR